MNEKTSESLKIINYVEIYYLRSKVQAIYRYKLLSRKLNQSISTNKNDLNGKSTL